jgi:hypothetical protein
MSAHNSIMQWLQDHPACSFTSGKPHSWVVEVHQGEHRKAIGFGMSYEEACRDLLTDLK